ncbi:acetyltransferase, GNAT family [Methylococcus capsulatus str. Bath]|jgi:GNAT superfamily N-acetyltransferase|uniref:Acetyltransferase, GNAT family n=1 Tax=Methylococcus capsulatus (strain ATCC 33009 / NCIMB 11132 / Bath) TaxID=243233 RepID=Q60CI7_METCA|nr:GNAT family N-acetyltransferase [Methylococcus capsulatus]AAU90674.1 acetyltransferase, GNAT family [Methylococcus capsulatus str. Bath]
MDILIRPAETRDIEAMVELLGTLFSIEADFTFDPDRQRRGLALLIGSSADRVLVAECEGRVIGMCSVQTLISTAEGGPVGLVEDMVVAREFRGKGIGRRLLGEIERWAADAGLTRLQLLADRTNEPALTFYGRRGWERTALIGLRKMLRDAD